MAKEYERTCDRCGTVWYLPKSLAKERAPNRIQMAGARIGAVGGSLTPFAGKKQELQLQTLEARRERALQNGRCPNCGSSSFSERKV
jgi:ribosomal protein S27AE